MPVRSAWAPIILVCGILLGTVCRDTGACAEATRPTRFPAHWRHLVLVRPVLLSRYNRVDGVVQSLGISGRLPGAYDRPPVGEVFGRLDVHVASLPHYRVRGGVMGVAINRPGPQLEQISGLRTRLAAKYRKETHSPDEAIVGHAENTLAALFAKNDYKNYYLAEGFAATAAAEYIPRNQKSRIAIDVAYNSDLHRPLGVVTEWTVLPVDAQFRPNITATIGREQGVVTQASIELKDTPRLPYRTIRGALTWESIGGSLGGDFTYDGVRVQVKGRQKMWSTHWLTVHGVAAARNRNLAPQHLLRLGGIGTLRGVPHQIMTGNRMWMVKAEYRLGGDVLHRPTFFPFSKSWVRTIVMLLDLGFLYDVGTAYSVPPCNDVLTGWFEGKATDNWGVFLSIANDLFRLEWASTQGIGGEHPNVLRLRVGLTL